MDEVVNESVGEESRGEKKKSHTKVIILVLAAALVILIVGALLVFFIVGLVMSQLAIYDMGAEYDMSVEPGGSDMDIPRGSAVGSGFAKIIPIYDSTGLAADGSFHSTMTNYVGTTIIIDEAGISLADTSDGWECTTVAVSKTTIHDGDTFILTAVCPPQEAGRYLLDLRIPYTVEIGGVTSSHFASGSIFGSVG